jgi:3-methyladenine DNA glycosylase AlkC
MAEALKDIYNEEFIGRLAKAVQQVYNEFDDVAFIQSVFTNDWPEKALKNRMRHITTCLHAFLPSDYEEAIIILKEVAPELQNDSLAGIIFPDFVEVYGMNDWDVSLPALEWFTQYSTSEYAVRPFIQQEPNRMIAQMLQWSTHSNHHVRRLASEGIRPRLPWGIALKQFKQDPTPVIPIVENLKEDESLYVRKSVANNLNDISKDHPAVVLNLVKEWMGKHTHTDWILKHACRGLLKKGDSQALELFGFQRVDGIQVENFTIDKHALSIGEKLSFSFQLKGNEAQPVKIRVEYAIDFVKAKGNRTRRVFKITENTLSIGETLSYQKAHSFKDLTTRKHYKGMHTLSVLINGEVKQTIDFNLE